MPNKTSNRLQKFTPQIMNTWEERTLKEVEAANLQPALALRDSLPIYLSQLVDALSTTIDRTEARRILDKNDSTRIGKKHGGERAGFLNYTMDQMILEYHILRQVICDVLETEAILTPVEREVIVCSIEQAVNDAATQFSDTLRDLQDQLAQTLAHDLRNPLSTVKVSAQMIGKRPEDEKGSSERSERIIRSVDRIDNMIQELLDASRLKANLKQPLEFKECDLDWLLKDITFELNSSNEDRIEIKSETPCMGQWNQDGLRRLVENIVTNAIKYSYPDTPITISLEQNENEAILKIHNLGEPIPVEDQPGLFEKFKRARSAENKIGWGLGLTVVNGMIAAHKGNIAVESDVTIGTTFIVKLPKNIS